jgi:prevent-host-death family protein
VRTSASYQHHGRCTTEYQGRGNGAAGGATAFHETLCRRLRESLVTSSRDLTGSCRKWQRGFVSEHLFACITGDTLLRITSVSIRDLRNSGGEVVDRAARGETITVTRAGKPVAELHGLPGAGLSAEALLEHWKRLPMVDPERLREDIDAAIDPSL